jgi:hypothetical protein
VTCRSDKFQTLRSGAPRALVVVAVSQYVSRDSLHPCIVHGHRRDDPSAYSSTGLSKSTKIG